MKKTIAVLAAVLVLLSGCRSDKPEKKETENVSGTAAVSDRKSVADGKETAIRYSGESGPANEQDTAANRKPDKKQPAGAKAENQGKTELPQETEELPIETETEPEPTFLTETEPASSEQPTETTPETEAPDEPETEPESSADETQTPDVDLDYGAAMGVGNTYAANRYGCVFNPSMGPDDGFEFATRYSASEIRQNGGQAYLEQLMCGQVDMTFGDFGQDTAGAYVSCICFEEEGVVTFLVYYG